VLRASPAPDPFSASPQDASPRPPHRSTCLGRFTSVSDFTINTVTAMGAGTLTLTAANGDQIFTTVTGEAVGGTPDRLQIDETFTITGGAGRFTGATGSFTSTRFADTTTVPRIPSSGSFEGTINLNR
jgi:hypothetical protein